MPIDSGNSHYENAPSAKKPIKYILVVLLFLIAVTGVFHPDSVIETYDSEYEADAELDGLPATGKTFNASVAPPCPDQAFIKEESTNHLIPRIIGAVSALIGLVPVKTGILGDNPNPATS